MYIFAVYTSTVYMIPNNRMDRHHVHQLAVRLAKPFSINRFG